MRSELKGLTLAPRSSRRISTDNLAIDLAVSRQFYLLFDLDTGLPYLLERIISDCNNSSIVGLLE